MNTEPRGWTDADDYEEDVDVDISIRFRTRDCDCDCDSLNQWMGIVRSLKLWVRGTKDLLCYISFDFLVGTLHLPDTWPPPARGSLRWRWSEAEWDNGCPSSRLAISEHGEERGAGYPNIHDALWNAAASDPPPSLFLAISDLATRHSGHSAKPTAVFWTRKEERKASPPSTSIIIWMAWSTSGRP